jgi:hypothetical protein
VTHEFRLANPVPLLLGYWTVQVDGQGDLVYAPDIYGRDPILMKAMGSVLCLAGHLPIGSTTGLPMPLPFVKMHAHGDDFIIVVPWPG